MPMPLGKQVFLAGVAASGSCAILYYLVQSKYPMKRPRQGRLLVLLGPSSIEGNTSDAFSRLEKEGKGYFEQPVHHSIGYSFFLIL